MWLLLKLLKTLPGKPQGGVQPRSPGKPLVSGRDSSGFGRRSFRGTARQEGRRCTRRAPLNGAAQTWPMKSM